MTPNMGTDRQKYGIEVIGHIVNIFDFGIELETYAQVFDPFNLGIEHLAGQTILRDPKTHHPASHGTCLFYGNFMAETAQVIGSRQPGRPGSHYQYVFTGGSRIYSYIPALCNGLIAQETLNRVNAYGLVHLPAVTGSLARMVANPPHSSR